MRPARLATGNVGGLATASGTDQIAGISGPVWSPEASVQWPLRLGVPVIQREWGAALGCTVLERSGEEGDALAWEQSFIDIY